MHKATTPDTAARRSVANAIYFEDSNIKKQKANRKWYELHKAWKKDYNAEYYRKNRDYWQSRYANALTRGNSRTPWLSEVSDPEREKSLNKNTRQRIQDNAEGYIKGGLWPSVASVQRDAQEELTELKTAEAMYKYYE